MRIILDTNVFVSKISVQDKGHVSTYDKCQIKRQENDADESAAKS